MYILYSIEVFTFLNNQNSRSLYSLKLNIIKGEKVKRIMEIYCNQKFKDKIFSDQFHLLTYTCRQYILSNIHFE